MSEKTEEIRRHSESLPMFRWTRNLVYAWMRITIAAWLPPLIRVQRDLFIDIYLIFMVPFLAALLVLNSYVDAIPHIGWLPGVSVVIAVWVLQEVACVTLHDVVRDTPIRGRRRWMLATLPTAMHVVLCFAILYHNLGHYFTPRITDWVTALYMSVVTFSTLGYGDIHPDHAFLWGRVLTICEMSLFLLLVVVRVPMAVSMIRMKDVEEPSAAIRRQTMIQEAKKQDADADESEDKSESKNDDG